MKTCKEQIQEAIVNITELSPAPRILAKALALLRSPHSDGEDIAKLIGADATLTADIIRCANSAFYGVSDQRVTTLGQAIHKIGFTETIRLLNTAVSRVMVGRDLGSYGISAEDFWAESLMHGIFLSELAKATNGATADEAYTAGLLRFIGRLAINEGIRKMGGGLFWPGDQLIKDWELENIGMTQAEAGALLLGIWQFPKEFAQAIRAQENPAAMDGECWTAEALAFTASIIPTGLGASFLEKNAVADFAIPENEPFMQRNNLTPDAVGSILEVSRVVYVNVVSNFGKTSG